MSSKDPDFKDEKAAFEYYCRLCRVEPTPAIRNLWEHARRSAVSEYPHEGFTELNQRRLQLEAKIKTLETDLERAKG